MVNESGAWSNLSHFGRRVAVKDDRARAILEDFVDSRRIVPERWIRLESHNWSPEVMVKRWERVKPSVDSPNGHAFVATLPFVHFGLGACRLESFARMSIVLLFVDELFGQRNDFLGKWKTKESVQDPSVFLSRSSSQSLTKTKTHFQIGLQFDHVLILRVRPERQLYLERQTSVRCQLRVIGQKSRGHSALTCSSWIWYSSKLDSLSMADEFEWLEICWIVRCARLT